MKKTKLTPSASRLMGIISSVTGADIMENSRRRPVVDARQLFYKIYREVGVYSFSDIGAFFGKNHATVIHGIKAIDLFISQEKHTKMIYERCKNLYFGELSIEDSISKNELIEKISHLDGHIIDLNSYIAELEDKLGRVSNENDDLFSLYEVVRMHTPKAKIEDAKKKVRAVLNGL